MNLAPLSVIPMMAYLALTTNPSKHHSRHCQQYPICPLLETDFLTIHWQNLNWHPFFWVYQRHYHSNETSQISIYTWRWDHNVGPSSCTSNMHKCLTCKQCMLVSCIFWLEKVCVSEQKQGCNSPISNGWDNCLIVFWCDPLREITWLKCWYVVGSDVNFGDVLMRHSRLELVSSCICVAQNFIWLSL